MARKKSFEKYQSNPQPKGDRGFVVYDPVYKLTDSNGKMLGQIQPVFAGNAGPKVSIGLNDGRLAFASHNPEVLESLGDWLASEEGKAFLKAWKAFKKANASE